MLLAPDVALERLSRLMERLDGRLHQPHGHTAPHTARLHVSKRACVGSSSAGEAAGRLMSTIHNSDAPPSSVRRPRCAGAAPRRSHCASRAPIRAAALGASCAAPSRKRQRAAARTPRARRGASVAAVWRRRKARARAPASRTAACSRCSVRRAVACPNPVVTPLACVAQHGSRRRKAADRGRGRKHETA